MKINKLVLTNFKKFPKRTVLFTDGINIVLGKNETGKSTIVEAILLALYDNPESKALSLKKYYSWNSDKAFIIEIEFEIVGKKYNLIKDFIKHEAELILPEGKSLTNIDLINTYLQNELKLPPKSVYQNSGFIKQDEIIKLDYDGEFKNSVQNLVVEGDEKIDVSNILKSLDKKISILNKGFKGNSVNPGPIKSLMDSISAQQREIGLLETKWNSLLISEARSKTISEELNGLKEKTEINKKFLIKIKSISQIQTQLTQANKRYDEIEDIESELKENRVILKEKKEYINTNFKDLEIVKSIEALEAEINSLLAEEKILSRVENKKDVQQEVETFSSKVFIEIGLLVLGIVFSLIAQNITPFIIGLVLGLGVFVLYKNNSKSKTSPTKNSDEELLFETENKLADICSKFNSNNVAELLNKIKGYKHTSLLINELETKEKIILGKTTVEVLAQNKRVFLKEITKLEEKLSEMNMQGKKYSDEAINNFEYELEKLESKIKTLEREGFVLDAQIKSSDISQESLNLMNEKLEEDKENLKRLNDELTLNRLVRDSIDNSYKGTVKDSKSVIEDIVNKNISDATNGRYTKIQLTGDFDLKVFSVEKNDFVACEELSKGTIDQIYLLTRLSFAQSLSGDQNMPFILDDPFVNFDIERLKNFKEILIKYSQKYQMILFTHNKFYSDWGTPLEMGKRA